MGSLNDKLWHYALASVERKTIRQLRAVNGRVAELEKKLADIENRLSRQRMGDRIKSRSERGSSYI